MQSLAISPHRRYEARIVYKVDDSHLVDLDIGLSVKILSSTSDYETLVTSIDHEHDLLDGWTRLAIEFSLTTKTDLARSVDNPDGVVALGLIIGIAPEHPSSPFSVPLFIGQLNVFPATPSDVLAHDHLLTWADFLPSSTPAVDGRLSGTLKWDAAVAFAPSTNNTIPSPEDPNPVWRMHVSGNWYPSYLYFNIYVQAFTKDGRVGGPELASWVGTTGWDGEWCRFSVDVPIPPSVDGTPVTQVRFYVQGVDDHGGVLPWTRCVFVDAQVTI
jgi:mannosyl-glycoprotein endo-beta-N-acetylglucosaminidase